MLHFHPDVTVIEIAKALRGSGLIAQSDGRGGAIIVRRGDAAKIEELRDIDPAIQINANLLNQIDG